MNALPSYTDFLSAKMVAAPAAGFHVEPHEVNPQLRDHVRAVVPWALAGGQRAIFARFGMAKTTAQIELARLVLRKVGGPFLIVLPLGVRAEFFDDAERFFAGAFAVRLKFIRTDAEIEAPDGDGPVVQGAPCDVIHLTNYESVREGKVTPALFNGASLDEAAVLRGYGTKTFQTFLPLFAQVRFKFVATATPSPNRTKELIHYAGFLGVMDTGQALTRFFQRNSEKAGDLQLFPHKEEEFWTWVASWALFLQKPSDLGFSDEGYELPGVDVHWHEVPIDHSTAGHDSYGQGMLLRDAAMGVVQSAAAKRDSLAERVGCMAEIVYSYRDEQSREEPALLREARGGRAGALAPKLSSEQAQNRQGEEARLHGGVSSNLQAPGEVAGREGGDQQAASGALCERPRIPCQDECSGEAELQSATGDQEGLPSQVRVQPDAGGVRSEASVPGWGLRDLRGEGHGPQRERSTGAVTACGSLPRDGEGEGPALSSLQFRAGSLQRQSDAAVEGGALSPQFVVWCTLNDEQKAVELALKAQGVTFSSVEGNHALDEKEARVAAWKAGHTSAFVSKPVMFGAGVNLQQCHRMIFVGIDDKFHDFIQAFHRIVRFGQKHRCRVDIIYSEAQREQRRNLEGKWREYDAQMERMSAIVRRFGLNTIPTDAVLRRSIGVLRRVERGDGFEIAHNDAVDEAAKTESCSVGQIVTSIPFSNHYEYCESFNDFGHTDDNAHFWAQMDFLTPELERILKPGRLACIHVKDRILFGNVTGEGVPTVSPFHAEAIFHYLKHGFRYLGMVTITTDVVAENNQTYRLTYSEMMKDATKMGVGCPEYMLIFRKEQSDKSRAYADEPVIHAPPMVYDGEGGTLPWTDGDRRAQVPGIGYTLARWQIDAHAFWPSSGNRLLTTDELVGMGEKALKAFWRNLGQTAVYDYEEHVRLGEELAARKALPKTFMLLDPNSQHDAVWTDIMRARTLNARQVSRGREKHVCPLQIDIVNRCIGRWSNPGDLIYDPFGGIGTVPYLAMQAGRRGKSSELNETYFRDALAYCREAEAKRAVPSLFDILGESCGVAA